MDVPDSTAILTVNALYRYQDDLRLVSGCVTDPGEGQEITLEGLDEEERVQ